MIQPTGDILTDALGEVVNAITGASGSLFPEINYQFGYVEELNETLAQAEKDPSRFDKKYPLIWVAEPYDMQLGFESIHGKAKFDLFIFAATQTEYKAGERNAQVFSLTIMPIYRLLLQQIVASARFDESVVEKISHKYRKGYYWDNTRSLFTDAVDCLQVSFEALPIFEKQNCTPKSF